MIRKISLRDLLILVIFIGLFWTRTFNLSNFLFDQKLNDFLDVVFSFGDIAVLFAGIFLFVKSKMKIKLITGAGFVYSLFQLFLLGNFNIDTFWTSSINFFRLGLWVYILFSISGLNIDKFHKYIFYIGLLVFGFFDHFILSSSQPILVVSLVYLLIKNNYPRKVVNIFFVFLLLNLGLAFYQVIFGKSLGLDLIGERVLSVDILNVAKIELFGKTILRGYGFGAHPNILAFIGFIGYWFFGVSRLENIYTRLVSVLLVVTSYSRSAFLAIALFLTKYSRKYLLLNILLVLVLVLISIGRSDSFRLMDIGRWFEIYSSSNLGNKLFGIGLGQYPEYLRNIGGLDLWQYQPVHNIFLGMVFEIGILPLIAIGLIFKKLYKYE